MDKLRISVFTAVLLLLLGSCKDEKPEDYYSTLGDISISHDTVYIRPDNDKLMWIVNKQVLGTYVKNNDRVIATFTLSDQQKPSGVDYAIDIYALDKVLVKAVIAADTSKNDSIGDDPVDVKSIWVAKKYLNLDFYYRGGNTGITHMINLVRKPGTIATDTVELEIRHNNKNDHNYNVYRGFVSFDLTSLKNDVQDSVVLKVKAEDYSGGTYSKNLVYKF